MELNIATTVSFSASATTSSLAVLGAYLSRRPATRHFRYAAISGFAGSLYCLTDAVLAARMSDAWTEWAGRLAVFAMCVHSAAWIAFIAAWDRRTLSRFERAVVLANVVAALLGLLPGLTAASNISERAVPWLGVVYRDPDFGPLGVPSVIAAYVAHLVATVQAFRMGARARMVSLGFGVFCITTPVDVLSALHVVALPNLADPALALIVLCIAALVVFDAAESAEKSVELEQARLTLAAQDNLAALGQLAAVVAHEVRNPVAVMFGALATLRKKARDEQDESLLAIVDEEANRLQQLVKRLLDAVRPFELQYSRVAISRLLEAPIAQVVGSTGIPPGEVVLTIAGTGEIECDELLLVQAISNLVQNAVEASGRRSPVQIRARIDDETLRVEVSDDGDGVRPESRARLFKPFFTTRATGTGLGLALVKRIAGAHGGTVDHTSPQGGGACFVLRVPLNAAGVPSRPLVGSDLA